MIIKRVKDIPVEPKKRGRPKGSKNKPKPVEVVRSAPVVKCDQNAKLGHDFQAKVGFTNPVCSKCGARKRGRPAKIVEVETKRIRGRRLVDVVVKVPVAKPQPKPQPDPDNPFVTKYGWSKKNKAEPCPKCGLIEVEGGYCTRCLTGWEKPAPYTPNRKETTGGPSTAVTEDATVQVTTRKYTVPLVHPRYSIEPCPKCGYPEADGGYCPECGWLGGSVGVTA